MVWCGLWAGGISGPYFFKNYAGGNVTVKGDRCRAMLINYLMPDIVARELGDIWFQQNGATSHTSHQSMNLLIEYFGEQIISRFGPVDWTTRSCDITSLDFFPWGYIKSKVYADNPASIQALEQNIKLVIRQLPVEMLE